MSAGCGYNDFQTYDEDVKGAWAEVLNQYQRRADLIPNLVNVVKGYAGHEKDVLTQVTEARSRVGSINATSELLNDEAAFKKFIAAQGQMTGALSRLMVVAENYPQLKADGMFRDLQAQLEGTENRITVARNRFIGAVKEFNVLVRQFPSNLTAMIFGYKTKPSFTVEDEKAIAVPPKVDFGTPAPAPATQAAPPAQPPAAIPAPTPAPEPTSQAAPAAPASAAIPEPAPQPAPTAQATPATPMPAPEPNQSAQSAPAPAEAAQAAAPSTPAVAAPTPVPAPVPKPVMPIRDPAGAQ